MIEVKYILRIDLVLKKEDGLCLVMMNLQNGLRKGISVSEGEALAHEAMRAPLYITSRQLSTTVLEDV